MNSTIIIEGGTESLLERLEADKVIAAQIEKINLKNPFPVTKELIYNYDFGDNWIVTITKGKNCNDLLENNTVSYEELGEAKETVVTEHRPVCINKEEVCVMDDVGGLSGFAEFLGTIYECGDKEESSNARAWANSLDWNIRKVSNKAML